MTKSHPIRARRQQGVTLIEVLITVVIIGIGLLGLAGLQTLSIKANRTALQRSYATLHAYSILDAMRVNRTAALNGDYDIDFDEDPPSGDELPIAGQDVKDWREEIDSTLPAGLGRIVVDKNTRKATIEIQWVDMLEPQDEQDDEAEAEPKTHTFTTESSL